MSVQSIGKLNNRFIGLSGDAKPTTGVDPGATFFEYDTMNRFIYNGSAWTLFESHAPGAIAITTINLKQAAGNYDLFQATAQALLIDFLTIIIPADLSGEAVLTGISIQSTDVAPVVFLSAANGVKAKLTPAGVHLIYRGPDTVAVTKKIQLTIIGGATAANEICYIYVSYRPAVAGGYLAVA